LIKFVTDRPGHDRRYALDSSKIKKEIGWKPRYSFDRMLAETVKWYKDNPDWIKSALRRLKKINPHIKI
ncbi:MAG: GDP-mannose 4,6-dehydratase, partial [Candidatus Paceibacteria bacterium]